MSLKLKLWKSAGVRVTAAVHRAISRGDAARDAEKWMTAAGDYERALARDPSLAHIWVQLGHARKETGDFAAASEAYATAVELSPRDPDALTWMRRTVGHLAPVRRDRIVALLRAALPPEEEPEASPRPPPDPGAPVVIFDVSDLVGHFGTVRLPTGIQRVQIEAIRSAIDEGERDVRIACAQEGREGWVEVPLAQFRRVIGLSVTSGAHEAAEWLTALDRMHLALALAAPFVFPQGATLLNLGTSWSLRNYFLGVRHAKATAAIRYVPFVHDMIPIMAPEHCVRELTQDFVAWVIGLFAHADGFLANSESTRRDLIAVAAVLGHALDPAAVSVIPLDADFRRPDPAVLPAASLARWGLAGEPFALFVATVESRKGHEVAFDAWEALDRRHGDRIPRLVCVGNEGWLNDRIYRRLGESPVLKRRVTMLSRLSDEELALLYRNCLFAIYPSRYEGWGLPISEALSYGKPVIAADNSSLPEAGGDHACYVATGSAGALADAVAAMSLDDAFRAGWEATIAAGYAPRSWRDVARQLSAEALRFSASGGGGGVRPPTAILGAWHPIRRSRQTRIWPGAGSGEMFRTGLGWHWPDDDGCWIRHEGGELAIDLPAGPERFRLCLGLRGGRGPVRWTVAAAGGFSSGTLDPGERLPVAIDIEPAGTEPLVLTVRAEPLDGNANVARTLAVEGFFLADADDAAGLRAFAAAAATASLETLDAYRPPATSSP